MNNAARRTRSLLQPRLPRSERSDAGDRRGVIGFMSGLSTILQRGLGEPGPVGWRSRGVIWDQRARARRLAVGLTGRWQLVGGLVLCAGWPARAAIPIALLWGTWCPGW